MVEHRSQAVADAKDRGYIALPLSGFPLYVEEDSNDRQVSNFVIQGTGADLLRHAVLNLEGYTIVSTLFDGLYGEAPLSEVEKVTARLQKDISRLFSELLPLPWTVEVQTCKLDGTPYFTQGLFEKSKYIGQMKTTLGEYYALNYV